jgi:hypothetical protein
MLSAGSYLSLLGPLKISLNTALTRLSLVVNILPLGLSLTVTSDSSTDVTHSTLGAVGHALAKIGELALGLLSLAISILLDTGLAKVFVADEVSEGLLGSTDGLVPRPRGTIFVVGDGGTAVGVSGEGANSRGSVGVFVFALSL